MTTKTDFDSIQKAVLRSVSQLQEREYFLLENDANERSISHKLGCYLSREFPDWDVDCEYNRNQHDTKILVERLVQNIQSDDTSGTTVYPDIIVHQRNTKNNLLVVEIKKHGNEQGMQQDKEKLEKFVEQLGYTYGLFISFQTGRNARRGELHWFRDNRWFSESFPQLSGEGEYLPTIANRVINTLAENKVRIFTKLHQRKSGVAKYPAIMQMYREEGCLSDAFQREYKTFYRLNTAGLSDEQKQRYFELMSSRVSKLEVILDELYNLPTRKDTHSVQFSFATKLLHTLDVDQPIYDSNVGTMFNLKVVGGTKKQKIGSCLEIYNFLKNAYHSMLIDGKIRSLISTFRKEFGYDENNMSDTKVLDFLIWASR